MDIVVVVVAVIFIMVGVMVVVAVVLGPSDVVFMVAVPLKSVSDPNGILTP